MAHFPRVVIGWNDIDWNYRLSIPEIAQISGVEMERVQRIEKAIGLKLLHPSWTWKICGMPEWDEDKRSGGV